MNFDVPKKGRVPQKHIPIAIVIDCSTSTRDIQDLLNQSIRTMVSKLQANVELRQQVELLAVHYSDYIQLKADFVPVCNVSPGQLDITECEGTTNTGMALLEVIQRLREWKTICDGRREKCSTPLVFLFTDGYPDAGDSAPVAYVENVKRYYSEAAEWIRTLEAEERLHFYAAGIQQVNGIGADMEALRRLTNHPEQVFRVQGASNGAQTISRFCQMICDAAAAIRASTPLEDAMEGMMP